MLALVLVLAAQDANKPPKLSVEKNVHAVAGAELFLSLNATDPDGDVLTFGAEGLPASARFETRTGDLLWTPADADVGTHAVTFSASDGKQTTYALARIIVGAREKLGVAMPTEELAEVGKPFSTYVMVTPAAAHVDVDGLPAGARFDPQTHAITWAPGDDDRGDHVVRVTATKDAERVDKSVVIHVRPKREEWISYALPGVGYATYYPVGSPGVGFMQGPRFEVVAVQWVHRNDNVGPSHGRVSLKADLLFPASDPADPAIIYAMSLALSLERNPERSWLLPYFAVDVGGLYQKQLGNAAMVTPALGVHVFQNRNVFISVDAGYLLALPALEKLHGPRVTVSGNFTLW